MTKGQLPIILSAAEQVTADPIAIQAIVWQPATSTDTVVLSDNQNNVLFQGKATTALHPVVITFAEPIPVQGLSLKQISANNLLLVYPAAL